MIKMAMVNVWESTGIVPYVTVHDELDCPVNDEVEGHRLKTIMEECVQLHVPMKADLFIGRSWGEAKEIS